MESRVLLKLSPGECGEVCALSGELGLKRRLQDLGLISGTKVHCLQRSPFGDPTAYAIRGAVIALRAEDSVHIHVK